MRKRIAIIIIPSFLFVAILTALILNQFSTRLPSEGQDVLDGYIKTNYPDVVVTTIMYAQHREQFTADMGRHLTHTPNTDYRISPVLYDGDIIQPPPEKEQFPLPPQQLWCITITRPNKPIQLLYLARHDSLSGETWALYQSQTSPHPPKSIGCTAS